MHCIDVREEVQRQGLRGNPWVSVLWVEGERNGGQMASKHNLAVVSVYSSRQFISRQFISLAV